MIQRRHGMDFALESIAELLGRHFDSYFATHARIAGTVNLTHATGTERRQDLIRTEPG
jgi:hypothetical protein